VAASKSDVAARATRAVDPDGDDLVARDTARGKRTTLSRAAGLRRSRPPRPRSDPHRVAAALLRDHRRPYLAALVGVRRAIVLVEREARRPLVGMGAHQGSSRAAVRRLPSAFMVSSSTTISGMMAPARA
jgi:hypothetical protein